MGDVQDRDHLLARARELYDRLAASASEQAEIQIRLDQLRFEAALVSGQLQIDAGYRELQGKRHALMPPTVQHELTPEARANLTFPVEDPSDERAVLKLRRPSERSAFALKATFGQLIDEFWPKVAKALPAEQQSVVRPKMLFDRIALDRGLDPQVLWRAWRAFVLPEQRKRVTAPLPSDWSRTPPNADRFEASRLDRNGILLTFDDYAADLLGYDASDLVGQDSSRRQLDGVRFDYLSDDADMLYELTRHEDEAYVVMRLTGQRVVLVFATMERLGLDGHWRVMWQLLHERERDSAITWARRLNHSGRYRDSKRPRRDSSAAESNYCHDSARDLTGVHACPRVTARITAGRRVA